MIERIDIKTIKVPITAPEGYEFKVVTSGGGEFQIASAVDNGDGTTTITSTDDITGVFFVGLVYEMRYKLGNLVLKLPNGDGRTQSTNRSMKDNLQTMTVAFTDASTFSVEIESTNRPKRVVTYTSKRMGISNIGESDLVDSEFRFHVRGKTRDTKVTVTDSSVFPLAMQHIEIERKVQSRSKR